MKFTVFALIAALCLVAVTANATDNSIIDHEDVEDFEFVAQDLAEELMDLDPFGIFTGMYFVFRKALKTIKTLNCTIKEVLEIQTAATNFVSNVQACGGEVSKKVQQLIDVCNDIITTCKDILGINESICGNTVNEDADTAIQTLCSVSGVKNGHKCFRKMLSKLQTLKRQINRALKLIKQIKKVPADTSACVIDAVNTVESYFTEFPDRVKSCSKLTS